MPIQQVSHCHFYFKSLSILIFLELWKKSNIIPVHKKTDKRHFENYCPISLLPIFSKVFKKIFNKMYTIFQNDQLFNPNQSGFRVSDSYINQLLSITHEIFRLSTSHRQSKLDQFFKIYKQLLTKFGIKGYFIN